ncbi:MAG: ABC transporter permease [Candidatus Nanopelagicales bacterium]|jgi:ABC-2 type transport system permease protein|nr:ABC transporter permease [Candidatus Nanopelagicales bacterium]
MTTSLAPIPTTPAPTGPGRPSGSAIGRVGTMLGRELKLGPRSPVVMLAVVMPLLMTFLVASVFGGLLESEPRLGVLSPDPTAITASAEATEGIRAVAYDSEEAIRADVADHDLDAALLLPAGFDAVVAGGEPVQVIYLVSGQALASDRAVLAATVTAMVREVAGEEAGVEVTVVTVGAEDFVPMGDRLIPLLVVYAVVVAALFVPAASILDERVKGTLNAVLATPASMGEVLASKALFASVLSVLMGVVTLLINQAFSGEVLGIVLALVLGTAMLVQLGLVLGLWVKDMNTLYTWIKAGGILIVLPGLLALFPTLPEWISKLAPTYYFLQPIYDLSVGGATLADVLPTLGICLLICVALFPLLWWSARTTEQHRLEG